MKEIRILKVTPGSNKPDEEILEYSTENLQKIVGGYLEAIRVRNDIVVWLNESGKLIEPKLEPSIILLDNSKPYDYIVGTAFFSGLDNEGNTVGLTDTQIEEIISRMGQCILEDGQMVMTLEMTK